MSGKSLSEQDYIRNVLVRNFGFKEEHRLSETVGFKCLSTSARDALLFATYSGEGFLQDEEFKLSLRTPIWRLLGRPLIVKESLRHDRWSFAKKKSVTHYPPRPSTAEWKQEYPNLFEGKKILVLFDFRTNVASVKYSRRLYRERFRSLIEGVKRSSRPFTDFISVSIPTEPREFYIGEEFFEYVSGMVLREKGYLVSPFYAMGGDINAFKLPDLIQDLRDKKIIPNGGFLVEIALHEIFGDVEPREELTPVGEKAIAATIEAESTPGKTKSHADSAGFGQALRYLRREFCGQAFVTGPLCFETHESIGTISFREDGTLFFNDAVPSSCDERIFDRVREVVRLLQS